MKKYQSFLSENFQFLEVKFSIYSNRRVFVMYVYIFQPERIDIFVSLHTKKKYVVILIRSAFARPFK